MSECGRMQSSLPLKARGGAALCHRPTGPPPCYHRFPPVCRSPHAHRAGLGPVPPRTNPLSAALRDTAIATMRRSLSSAWLSTAVPVSCQASIKVLNASGPAEDTRLVALAFISPVKMMSSLPRAASDGCSPASRTLVYQLLENALSPSR